MKINILNYLTNLKETVSSECFKRCWNTHKSVHNAWEKYQFTGPLRPWPQAQPRSVPPHIPRPDYASHPEGASLLEEKSKSSKVITCLNDEDIETMRRVCGLAREVLEEASKVIKVGITTDEIDRVVHEACIERNCYPSPLNYYKFPRSVCTSVNEIVCHGIPDTRPLEDGDIVNVDVTVFKDGFHGDLNETFLVGNVGEENINLIRTAHECLMKAIEIVKPGVHYKEIGSIIQQHAVSKGFYVDRNYTGHGIHRLFHCPPTVLHYSNNRSVGIMKAGHTFTIEPMINKGTWHDKIWPDDWTVATMDGKPSAQFEQTLLVTQTGCEILTARKTNNGQPYFMDQLSSK